jgi:trehalose-6-phosphate synthase
MIMGIDKLHSLSSISLKFLAYKQFLKQAKNPEQWRLYQVCFCDTYLTDSIKEYKNTIEGEVKSINSELGFNAIELRVESLSLCEIIAIMNESTCFLVTSFRANFQVFSVIYIYLSGKMETWKHIIASEFTGIGKSLTSVLIINPYDIKSIVSKLMEVADNKGADNMYKIKSDFDYICTNDTIKWGTSIIEDAIRVQKRVI